MLKLAKALIAKTKKRKKNNPKRKKHDLFVTRYVYSGIIKK